MNLCGTKSGRECNKIMEAGLTKIQLESGNITFDEASLVFECKKIYTEDFDNRRFLDKKIEDFYLEKYYHKVYTGEVIKTLI